MKKVCFKCAKSLPKDARANRKYCSIFCKNAATKKRSRNATNFSKLEQVQKENEKLWRLVAATNRARVSRDRARKEVRELAVRQADTIAASTLEIRTAAMKVADTIADTQKIVSENDALHKQLEAVMSERDSYYGQLVSGKKSYDRLVSDCRQIVKSWDILVQDLLKKKPKHKFSKVQRESIVFWVKFHKTNK